MPIVYRHIRKDTNQVFYIGIGKNEKRAYSKKDRNNHWYNIAAKTDYEVQIIFYDLTWEESCEKEREFITLYGRKDLGLGSLVNLTDGGQGTINQSEETRNKRSDAFKGNKNPMFGRKGDKHHNFNKPNQLLSIRNQGKIGSKHHRSRKIAQYSKDTRKLIKLHDSMMDIERDMGINHSHISKCCTGKLKSAGGFCWKYVN